MKKVQIEKLIFGGMGLARTNRGVVFIPGVLPGEIVNITIQSKYKGTQIAYVDEIVSSSADRREPPCRMFGMCGGCDWLHINPIKQFAVKNEIFIDCFRRIGGITDLPDVKLFSSPEFNYRIRGQLQIASDGHVGFYRKHSHEVVPVTRCPLFCDRLNPLFLYQFGRSRKEKKRSLKVLLGDSVIASNPVLPGLTQDETMLTVNKRVFKINGRDFFQSNRYLNESLGTWAVPFIGGKLCIDMYGGAGFFSLMVSHMFREGLLIESDDALAKKAGENFKQNEAAHFRVVTSKAENILSFCSKCPDLVIVDPPRCGLTVKVKDALSKLKPRQILYVSCNVSTQARDCAFLIKNAGYSISKAALFDCYPNTVHLESAILLECKT